MRRPLPNLIVFKRCLLGCGASAWSIIRISNNSLQHLMIFTRTLEHFNRVALKYTRPRDVQGFFFLSCKYTIRAGCPISVPAGA